MARAKTARKNTVKANRDTSQYEDALDFSDAFDSMEAPREAEGCLELGAGSFLRMRPPGFGPDFEAGSAYFD